MTVTGISVLIFEAVQICVLELSHKKRLEIYKGFLLFPADMTEQIAHNFGRFISQRMNFLFLFPIFHFFFQN